MLLVPPREVYYIHGNTGREKKNGQGQRDARTSGSASILLPIVKRPRLSFVDAPVNHELEYPP